MGVDKPQPPLYNVITVKEREVLNMKRYFINITTNAPKETNGTIPTGGLANWQEVDRTTYLIALKNY